MPRSAGMLVAAALLVAVATSEDVVVSDVAGMKATLAEGGWVFAAETTYAVNSRLGMQVSVERRQLGTSLLTALGYIRRKNKERGQFFWHPETHVTVLRCERRGVLVRFLLARPDPTRTRREQGGLRGVRQADREATAGRGLGHDSGRPASAQAGRRERRGRVRARQRAARKRGGGTGGPGRVGGGRVALEERAGWGRRGWRREWARPRRRRDARRGRGGRREVEVAR